MGKTKKPFIVGIVIILLTTMSGLDFLFHKGKDFKGTDEFVKELKSRNYNLECIEDMPKDKVRWFSGDAKILNSSNIELSVFEFSSEEIANNEASKVSKDGFEIHGPINIASNNQNGGAVPLVIYMSWSDNPHFYRSGNLIALYCGTNLKVQYDLYRILGRQFAGLPWYIPGRKR